MIAFRYRAIALVLCALHATGAADPLEGVSQADHERMDREMAIADARVRQQEIARCREKLQETGDPIWVNALMAAGLDAASASDIYPPLLDHENPYVQQMAAEAILRHGTELDHLLPALLVVAKDPTRQHYVRVVALQAASAVAPQNPDLLRCLDGVLTGTSSPDEIKAALVAAEAAGPAAVPLLPAVERHQGDDYVSVSYAAWRAAGILRAVEPPPWDLVESRGLLAFQRDIAWQSFHAVTSPDAPAEKARALLAVVISAPDVVPPVRLHALRLLAEAPRLEAECIRAAAPLADLHVRGDNSSANAARDTLRRAQPDEREVIDALLGVMSTSGGDAAAICAERLGGCGAAMAAHAAPACGRLLASASGATATAVIGGCLDVLKTAGVAASSEAQVVRSLLAETSPLYTGREKADASAIRGYALLALMSIGLSRQEEPAIVDLLINEDHLHARAIAARAAGALGRDGGALVQHLIAVLGKDVRDDMVLLDRFDQHHPHLGDSYTLIRCEAIRSLRRIGKPAAVAAVPILRERAADPHIGLDEYPDYQSEAALVADELSR